MHKLCSGIHLVKNNIKTKYTLESEVTPYN